MRAILAGGGTGGHVIPALAIAHELRQRYGAEVLFVGTARGIENRLVPAAGFALRLVEVGALKRVSLLTRVKTLFDLPRAIVVSAAIIRDFRPQVMIGVGGYASGPAMLAAALSGLPTVAFEPNYVPGFANRMVAPMVSAAAVQFADTCRFFRNCRVTGVPVRRAFFEVPPRGCPTLAEPGSPSRAVVARDGVQERGEARVGYTPSARPTLLIFGGSQGAHALNQAMLDSVAVLRAQVPDLHLIHQTGERDYNDARAAYLRAEAAAEVYPFIDDMPQAFARADLLLCRSGASTVAEITAAGKPAIFVPFPRAADDHQRRNAEALVKAGAALMIAEADLAPARLVEAVTSLLRDRRLLARMGQAARALAHPDAARDIAALAVRLAGHPRESSDAQAEGTSVA